MIITPNMSLTKWDSVGDFFSHAQLAANFQAIDDHDHTTGKGTKVPFGGLGVGSVGSNELRSDAVLTANITDGQVTLPKLSSNIDILSAYSTYKRISPDGWTKLSAKPASTYILHSEPADFDYVTSQGVFYLDPADYTAGTRTTKYRVRAECYTGSTSLGVITFTAGLYPVTAVTGASPIASLGTVTLGSTVAFVNPGTSTRNQGNSGDFTAPAAGYYALAVTYASNMPASTNVVFHAHLQMRQV